MKSKTQQHSKQKINKNDLTNVNCENAPKSVDENYLFRTYECDDDVDDVEDLTRRNDASVQDENVITDKDTIFHQQNAESNTLGMMSPEQIAHGNTDKGNMTLT